MKKNKTAFFLIVFFLIIKFISSVFTPNWNYPVSVENVGYSVSEFWKHDYDVDVFFIGNSHMEFSSSPMLIYEDYGIVSYNIATLSQTPIISRYFVSEIFANGYKPKAIIYDVGNLFSDNNDEYRYRYIVDNPYSKNKISLITDYIRKQDLTLDENTNKISWIFPLYKYHSRWQELNLDDFMRVYNKNYFTQGFYINPYTLSACSDMESIDYTAQLTLDNQKKKKYFSDGIQIYDIDYCKIELNNDNYYDIDIPEDNIMCLEDIHRLCDENNCKLILVKVPVMCSTGSYKSAWTHMRYETIKKIALDRQIPFIDLQFDEYIGIDWKHDTCDIGAHLNLLGAEKVSLFLGKMLANDYGIPSRRLRDYDKKDLLYRKAVSIARIELAYTLSDYVDSIKHSNNDFIVLISVKDDMRTCLSDDDIRALKQLNLKSDFFNMEYNDSFIAIIDNNNVIYEATSNREQEYENLFDFGKISISSAGYLDGNLSSIIVNGTEYSMNQRGINIVVLDKETGLIVDSSNCDTWDEYHEVKHDHQNFLFDYQESLLNIN